MQKSLEKLGLSPKEATIYLKLLELDPSPLRKIAEETDMNRGSAYDSLKSLMKKGLVSFYDKDKKQHFVAEDPEILLSVLRDRRREVVKTKKELEKIMPDLQARFGQSKERPSVKLYEGSGGARTVLEDVLRVVGAEKKKEYYVYSAFTSNIKERLLYKDFESFSDRRIANEIKVKVVGLGSGGELRGLDERRTLHAIYGSPSYVLIYGPKVATLSLSKENYLMSVIVEDRGLADNQRIIFESLWKTLPEGISRK
jgi:sugar-specific transcriptional regulator TrmB